MKNEMRVEPLEHLILERLNSGRADSVLMISCATGRTESEILKALKKLHQDGKVLPYGAWADEPALWCLHYGA